MNFEKCEYEMQHFNFSVEQLKLESHLFVKNSIKEITKEFAENLVIKLNISNEKADEVRNKANAVTEKIFKSFEEILGQFDDLAEEHFSIPENILLGNDLRHGRDYTVEDEKYYKEKIAEQEKTFSQNAYILTALEKELDMYKTLKPTIDRENEIAHVVAQSLHPKVTADEANKMVNKVEEIVYRKKNLPKRNCESSSELSI